MFCTSHEEHEQIFLCFLCDSRFGSLSLLVFPTVLCCVVHVLLHTLETKVSL